MIAAIPRFFEFYSNFLIESLTALRKQGLLYTEIGKVNPMLAPAHLSPIFHFVSPQGLPEGALVTKFRPEPYNWTLSAGPIQEIEISELLVTLVRPDGSTINNQKYFEAVHAAGLEAKVDKLLILAAIDFAVENDLIGQITIGQNNEHKVDRIIAVNVFQASFTRDLIDTVVERLAYHGLTPGYLMTEKLEHKTEITAAQIDAVEYGHSLGLNLAIDDVDPRDPHDRDRVRVFGPYANIVKVKREVMRDVRNGLYDPLQFEADLASMIEGHSVLVVAEGVPRKHHDRMPLSVNATQSMWGDLPPPTGK